MTVPVGARAHAALDADHELVAQPLRLREHLRRIRIEYHLQQALAIAQIDEDDAAVIAPAMHPAGDLDLLLRKTRIHLPAVMATHGAAAAARRHPG